MSTGLAISGVTYVLQYYLGNVYSASGSPFTNPVTVSCLAPDLVQDSLGNGSEAENQVNLFLHQVTHNAAWRNVELPSLGADGKTRLKSPPLALDLHYLLTVYATDYWQAEALLGYALMMLHENPVIVRDDITNALQALTPIPPTPEPYPNNPLTTFLGSSGLADQIEMIKITPETLGREEMAWLWTALKADYRPTFPFLVSVVLMQPQQQTNLALPVLRRRVHAQPMQRAQILQVQPPGGQIAAASTDTVTVTGEFLSGVSQVSLSNPRYGVQFTVPVLTATSTSISFVPNKTLTYPAGVYDLSAQLTDASGGVLQSTNTLPIAVAPSLATQTATVVVNATGKLVTVTFTPNALEGQEVSLALSTFSPPAPVNFFSMSAPAQPFTGSAGTLSFQFPASLPGGPLLGRLQVDGITSQVQVNWSAHPPTFTGPLVTI
jgi:Pvc16 N-terminal domain